MTTNYIHTHKKNIVSESNISKNKMESGSIVMFNYKGIQSTTPRPMVLVLNPNWHGKLHGVKLDVLSESELVRLTNLIKVRLRDRSKYLANLRLPMLKVDISSPQKFYNSRMKRYIRQVKQNPYRTYFVSNIGSVTVLDYRFKGMAKDISKRL